MVTTNTITSKNNNFKNSSNFFDGATPNTMASSPDKSTTYSFNQRVRDFEVINSSNNAAASLGALKQEVIRARMAFFARGFFNTLANVADDKFNAPLALTYIDFANFHRLDDCGEHNVISVKDAFANEGQVLSDVTSFAYDGLSEE